MRVPEWLSANWPDAVTAVAAVATLLIVLWDRFKPAPFPVDAQLRVTRNEEFGAFLGELVIARPQFGFYEIELVEAPSLLVAGRGTTGGYDPITLPPENAQKQFKPGWTVGMHGQHQSASFLFWLIEPVAPQVPLIRSITPQNVIRVRLSISLKAAKVLRSKITITSNRIV
jgi:hypothetical protein